MWIMQVHPLIYLTFFQKCKGNKIKKKNLIDMLIYLALVGADKTIGLVILRCLGPLMGMVIYQEHVHAT